MSDGTFLILGAGGIWLAAVGWFLIDTYFRRKETFVDRLQDKMKGSENATFK